MENLGGILYYKEIRWMAQRGLEDGECLVVEGRDLRIVYWSVQVIAFMLLLNKIGLLPSFLEKFELNDPAAAAKGGYFVHQIFTIP